MWDETRVGEIDEQVCPFGNDEGVPEGSKATRYCGPEGWMTYNGDACIPEATHILIQLAMVYDLSMIGHNFTFIAHMSRYNLSLLFRQ